MYTFEDTHNSHTLYLKVELAVKPPAVMDMTASAPKSEPAGFCGTRKDMRYLEHSRNMQEASERRSIDDTLRCVASAPGTYRIGVTSVASSTVWSPYQITVEISADLSESTTSGNVLTATGLGVGLIVMLKLALLWQLLTSVKQKDTKSMRSPDVEDSSHGPGVV
jgi:hypothetical protein